MRTAAVIVTALAGLALAGCGGGAKHSTPGPPAPMMFTAPTTTTIASPTTGQAVHCAYHGVSAGASVPSAGHGVAGSADGTKASAMLNLTRNNDGSLVVSCTP
jgi:hypothetical protein